jgi:hypothetical protein
MNILIRTRVMELLEKQITTSTRKGENNTVISTQQKLGWFVHFEGSYEALFVGDEKPEGLEKGTEVDIIIAPRKK